MPIEFKDYYQTLGVTRDAPAEVIKKAFRRLARKYHPDVSKEKDAEARMKDVNEAYAVLSDPERRAAYNRLGRDYQNGQEFRPPPGPEGGFEYSGHGFSPHETADFSDFFSQLFRRMGAAGRADFHAQGNRFHVKGEDHHAKVLLDVEDTFTGASRQISLRTPYMNDQNWMTMQSRTLNVKIPKGVREGQVIRLAGQGAPSMDGAPAGDLLLEVHFKPHPRFRVDGADLYMRLPVAPWEAAMGTVIGVDLPTGQVKVRIPENTQSDTKLRVRGKGIPSHPPGDLLLDILVVLPRADTPKARQMYETMARELAFNPRLGDVNHA